MRILSATLDAAQKRHIGEPVAQVVIDDRHCGILRPRWQLVVEDTAPDGPHAACMTYDGSCLRARTDPAAGKLYAQRVSDAASAPQWTAWTLLDSSVAPASQTALAWDGNTIQALFYVAADLRTIKVRESSDNGQTWSAAATVATLASGHACRSLAASLNAGSGALFCVYADETAEQAVIYITTRAESGGAWSSAQSWGRESVAALHGLAVDGVGGELRIAAGINHSLCLFAVPVDSLAAWPDPDEALHSDNESITYGWPSIALNFDPSYHIFFTTSNSLAGSVRLSHIIAPSWQTASIFPRPYAMTADFGASAMADSTHHYLCTGRLVYRAKRWIPDASQRVAVSADVHSLHLEEFLERAGRLALTLRNDDGRYATVGVSGAYQAIKQGSQVSVRLGYRTAAGDEVSYFRPFWVTSIEHRRMNGVQRLLIYATDGWGILERTLARQAYAWSERTIISMLTALLAGFGFSVSNDGDDAWSRIVPNFAINPAVSLASAVRSLLQLAGGCLIFRSNPLWEASWPSATAYLTAPSAASVYCYGAGHDIFSAHYVAAEQEATHVTALGQGQVMGDAVDWDAVELGDGDRLALVVDRRLATAAEAVTRAGEELAARRRQATAGVIVVPPNVGQEILDAVTITDAQAGLSGAVRLVVANDVLLDREKGVFEQRVELSDE